MNIKKIKLLLEKNKGKKIRFKFNGARNQTEEFFGIIEQTYNYVFIIKLLDNGNLTKCFSYADILTNSLEFFIK